MTKEESAPDDAKVGSLYTKTGDAPGTSIEVIPLLYHQKRTKFSADKEKPDCTAIDAKIGNTYGDCDKCAYSKFQEGVKTGCSFGHSYFVVTKDFKHLYQVDFSKTSSK